MDKKEIKAKENGERPFIFQIQELCQPNLVSSQLFLMPNFIFTFIINIIILSVCVDQMTTWRSQFSAYTKWAPGCKACQQAS